MTDVKLAHYLCIRCNAAKLAAYVIAKETPQMYAVCGHPFEYGKDGEAVDEDKCVVCLSMFEGHEESHAE